MVERRRYHNQRAQYAQRLEHLQEGGMMSSNRPELLGGGHPIATTSETNMPELLGGGHPTAEESCPHSMPFQWNWQVRDALQPWDVITKGHVDAAENRIKRSVTSFRAQVIGGRLYVTDIRALWFARQFTASAKLTLLAVLRNFKGEIPDLDIVVNQGDYPVVLMPKSVEHLTYLYGNGPYPVIFSPTSSSHTLDLMWPDFSFMPPLGNHELKTPRWDVARKAVMDAAQHLPWQNKLDFAAWTGNTQAEPRMRLAQVARDNPDELFVNSIYFKTPPGRLSCHDIGMGDKGGFQAQNCSMAFEELCRYRYLVNVGSNGYANKLKYLFLCGSVVIHVHDGSPNHEFFEHQLLPGMHYYSVSRVEEVAEAVRYLRAHPAQARAIAAAGTKRMEQLSFFEVTRFLADTFKEYGKRMNYQPTPGPDSFEVNCEDDLWRHYNIHGELHEFLTEDNSTCLFPPHPAAQLEAPGWGGYWDGKSGPTCEVANDLPEVPHACDEVRERY